jgi:hypothetical protein
MSRAALLAAVAGLALACLAAGALAQGRQSLPKAWVGKVTGTFNNHCCSSNITVTWTAHVRFVLIDEGHELAGSRVWGYEAASGNVTWELHGKDGPCTVRGQGRVPIVMGIAPNADTAIRGTLFVHKNGQRYKYIADLTGIPEERSPVTKTGCEGGGRLNQTYLYSTLPHTDRPMRRTARTLTGTGSQQQSEKSYRWSWSLTAVG